MSQVFKNPGTELPYDLIWDFLLGWLLFDLLVRLILEPCQRFALFLITDINPFKTKVKLFLNFF